ncbi:MAG TPA: Crp/Fnr family transcriptional regulator [Rhodocyclaceae bacterium]|nr:Crp/Fnr family transcriptional regulator [Rhodocyclaceae bacterium]HNA03998.1 Crp/Fnr family transcriptional regulator [Rhodocyclaceae bacterium]
MAAIPKRKRNESSECQRCVLHNLAACPARDPASQDASAAWIDSIGLQPDSVLFNLGERANAVYCLRSGVMKLVRYDLGGNQRIVRILTAGDLAALESAFEHAQQHTAVAVTQVQLCRIPAPQFRQWTDTNDEIRRRLLAQSRSALRKADYWLSELVGNTIPARVRLARLLLQLRVGDSDEIHRLRLVDYGGILGIAPETACRILNELMDDGVLTKAGRTRDGRLFRGDIEALMQLASEETAAA